MLQKTDEASKQKPKPETEPANGWQMKETARRAAAPDTLGNYMLWRLGLCPESQRARPGLQKGRLSRSRRATTEIWFCSRASGRSQNSNDPSCTSVNIPHRHLTQSLLPKKQVKRNTLPRKGGGGSGARRKHLRKHRRPNILKTGPVLWPAFPSKIESSGSLEIIVFKRSQTSSMMVSGVIPDVLSKAEYTK